MLCKTDLEGLEFATQDDSQTLKIFINNMFNYFSVGLECPQTGYSILRNET